MGKYLQIVEAGHWVSGSGMECTSTTSSDIIECDPHEMSWDWLADVFEKPAENEDYMITVKYYAADADPMFDTPIAEHSTWLSDAM